MSAPMAIANFDRYLSGLKLAREEHVAIQLHIDAIRKAMGTVGE